MRVTVPLDASSNTVDGYASCWRGSESVARHQRYRFHLKPGRYVLRGHYAAGGNVEPWTYAVIRAGHVTRQNIPNVCK
jgi:hypothetical protein